MRGLSFALLTAAAVIALTANAPKVEAQVGVSVGIAPDCPYGYYEESPYGCAPAGYYGPEWFDGGVFIGAGPWFRGHDDFRGHVDNRFREDHGYKGELPKRGDKADESKRMNEERFHGNEVHDGHGHRVNENEKR